MASKRYHAMRAKVDRDKSYPAQQALKMVKEGATAKFNESVDVSLNLGIDASKSDQTVRGSVVLPQGTGKSVRKHGPIVARRIGTAVREARKKR